MVKRSQRPFYTIDDSDDGEGEIIIPERVLRSFINNASQEAPKVVPRIANKGLTFIGVRVVDGFLRTGKAKADAKSFDRFVKNAESNQRMFCSQKYIENFLAEGTLKLDTTIIKSDDLRKLMEYGGKYYGIGSARPQGYGRFMIAYWDMI